jgi:AMMECR1 domain-containing protein
MTRVIWPTDIPLEPVSIIGAARRATLEAFDSAPPIVLETDPVDEVRVACVTLRWRGRVRGCWSGRGRGWRDAIRAAAFQALADPRRRPINRRELDDADLEVWLQTEREPISAVTAVMLWGKTGVEVEGAGRSAFFLPAVPIERRIEDPDDLLERLFRKARLFSSESRSAARLYSTTWRHFAEGGPGGEPCELHAMLPHPPAPFALKVLAETIGDHLAGLQRSDGRYLYALDPVKDQTPELDEHPVRLVGCTLALARLAQSSGLSHARGRLLAAAEKGEAWIEAHVPRKGFGDGRSGRLLGVTAMALLTYAALPSSPRRAERIAQFRSLILAAQRPDGSFASSLNPEELPTLDPFGPPQAVLALTREGVWTPEVEPALVRAFQAYQSDATPEASPFFLAWHAKAWFAVVSRVPNPEVARWADRLVDQLLARQIGGGSEPPDWRGGFRVDEQPYVGRPPSFLAALFIEAVLASERMRRDANDMTGAAARRQAAEAGLAFLARLVIEPRQAFLLRSPEVALGGVRRDLASFDLRCDYAMHLGTCLAAALEASREPNGSSGQ